MTKENQPTHSENILLKPFHQFFAARWQTKLLIFGGIGLIIATA